MKSLLASLLAFLGLGPAARAADPAPASAYMDLRAMALAVKPNQIGLSPASYSEKPWGVLMETAFEGRGSFTLLVLADGTTSLYFSKGGGMLGEGRRAEVRAASSAMLETAARLAGHARATTATPLPSAGSVNFYFLTAKGTLRYLAAERLLGTGEDPMSELFYAGQAVLAEFGKIAEKRDAKAVPQ